MITYSVGPNMHVWSSLPSGVSIASEARLIIAVYSRFYDICVYLSIIIYIKGSKHIFQQNQ